MSLNSCGINVEFLEILLKNPSKKIKLDFKNNPQILSDTSIDSNGFYHRNRYKSSSSFEDNSINRQNTLQRNIFFFKILSINL